MPDTYYHSTHSGAQIDAAIDNYLVLADAATTSAANAAAAASSASSANTSKTSAAGSATAAANSATSAATSKTNAAESATAAASSASSANTSKTSAAGSATAAAASAAAAEESASTIDVSNFPPISHASSGTTYGVGTWTLNGHLKLDGRMTAEHGEGSGYAATPASVKDANDLAAAAMPKTGGTFTGNVTISDNKEIVLGTNGGIRGFYANDKHMAEIRAETLVVRDFDRDGYGSIVCSEINLGSEPVATRTYADTKAPLLHASANTTYGKGSGAQYGHLKLSNLTNSSNGIDEGIASTPYAVKLAYDKANAAMPKSGGGFTGKVTADYANQASSCVRNIGVKTAAGTIVATSSISFTRK